MQYWCNNAWHDSLCLLPMFLILDFKYYAEYSNTRQIDNIKQFDKNLLNYFETVQLFTDFNFYFKLSNVVFLGSVKNICSLTKNKCTLQVRVGRKPLRNWLN